MSKGKARDSSASQGLAYRNLLFEIEQGLSEETAEKRYEQRLRQAKNADLADTRVVQSLLLWNEMQYIK